MQTVYQADTQSGPVSTLLVRTAGTTDRLAPRIVETIRNVDPNRPVDHVQTLEEIRDDTIAPQRLNATLIGLFALLALAIATVGVSLTALIVNVTVAAVAEVSPLADVRAKYVNESEPLKSRSGT